ncbi:DUF1349 domain-containing protein [Luteimonas kalidii]|uniref:DUF1349 domain-containing protein n=1 Tax=Luteimonas kalidii TaxID=3042025 RepID=A0ABT6JQB3_9GAMM|nr:DUF1349 domain-containing protein [Luteimonas kalidii]MDH5832802.1 DUF1349 domain-containing protein [Luteimonas kalidii]
MHARLASTLVAVFLAMSAMAADGVDTASVDIDQDGLRFTRAANGAQELHTLEAGRLELRSPARRDNFRHPDGQQVTLTAPMLLTEIDNTRPFTFTARVRPTLHETYDAGTLYVWASGTSWLKMALERDERRLTRMVTVRTEGTSDDNNHDVVTGDAVYMKISSDATTIGFYYSPDRRQWQLVRLYRNAYPDRLWLGLSSQSPLGEGNATVFEDVALVDRAVSDFRLGE